MSSFLRNIKQRYEAQNVLFADKVSRLSLQQLNININHPTYFSVNVWRNHSIEPVISLCRPYLSYGNMQVEFCISDYDDTFMFSNHQVLDVEFLWLDSSRYLSKISCEEWITWLFQRVAYLRKITQAPIIIATWLPDVQLSLRLQEQLDDLPMVYFADLHKSCSELGISLIDERTSSLAGTKISALAQVLIARKMSCQWLPGVVLPPIKAIILDLDHTLHLGVLAEDGIEGVELTECHKSFQNFIKSLQQKGIFITLVSHNNYSDVQKLFVSRHDYPLRWADFSAVEASWANKSDSIGCIAEKLKISYDSMLFIDDNIGELINVCTELPQIHSIHATSNAKITQSTLENYPGLWRWKVELDDKKRVKDLKMNTERSLVMANSLSTDEYFRSLGVSLVYSYDILNYTSRLADLCNKTNQFNLAINRFNQVNISTYMQNSTMSVCSVQLKDCLSDSGTIAVIIARRNDKDLLIEEVCISCRALGRRLEDVIIIVGIQGMKIFAGTNRVSFYLNHGDRNQPALNWIKKLLGYEKYPVPGWHSVASEAINAFVAPNSILIDRA
jgi:FkbH-like protein